MAVETYEEVPYASRPYAYATPDRLATVARLHGLRPPDVRTARVLEIGCSEGGNLIPRALVYPDATFVGIDPGAHHIREAHRVTEALGLRNITFERRGVEDLVEADGPFDYIICHGVYSWVDEAVQGEILRACHRFLVPNGVAYVSYNTLPGWNVRRTMRDAMLFHVEPLEAADQRIAQSRAMLAFLAESTPAGLAGWKRMLQQELDLVEGADDHYLFHDHLSPNNRPVYVRDFIGSAEGAGLRYLGEAELGEGLAIGLDESVQRAIDAVATTPARRQQYIDFLVNRAFRRSLLIRRDGPAPAGLDWTAVRDLWVGSDLGLPDDVSRAFEEGVETTFVGSANRTMTTASNAVKVGWMALAARYPDTIAFMDWVDLISERVGVPVEELAEGLARNLVYAYGRRLAELFVRPAAMSGHLVERPRAFAMARLQALAHCKWATTRRHECYQMDVLDHHLLAMCDGRLTRDDMVAALAELARHDVVSVRNDDDTPVADDRVEDVVRELMDERLTKLGQLGLLESDQAS